MLRILLPVLVMCGVALSHGDMEMDKDMPNDTVHMEPMKMYFHTGSKLRVLFYAWYITTTGGMVASCFGIFLIAALYEGLKFFREHLSRKRADRLKGSTSAIVEGSRSRNSAALISPEMLSGMHVLQTLLHMLQVVVSYFLMLIFMTYNIWLALAIVLGAGLGYYLFGWRRPAAVDVTEHCH